MEHTNWFSRHVRKGSIFTSWIILFFILVLVAFIIMGIYFYSLNAALERNLAAYNTARTEQVSTEVDASATRLALIASNLSNSLNQEKRERLKIHDERSRFVLDLALQLDMNRDIFGIYIYMPDSNEVISSTGIIKERYFYSGYFDTERYSHEDWKSFLMSEASDYFCFFPFADSIGKGLYKLTYVLQPKESNVKIMVALNSGNILAGDPYFSQLTVADKAGELYSIFGNEKELSIEELPAGGEFMEIDDSSYATSVDSSIPGLRYIMLTEKNVLNKDLNLLQFFSVLYMIAFLIVGLILAWYFSLRQYKPLSGILDILKSGRTDESGDEHNEYIEIRKSISDMMSEKAALMRAAHKSEVYLKERAVSRLFAGRALDEEIKELVGIVRGTMCVVRIIWNEEKTEQFKNDFELLQFAVKNVAGEMFSEIAKVYAAASDNVTAVDLLLVLNDDGESIKEKTAEIAENFVGVMKSQLGIEMGVILGRIIDSTDRLPAAYSEVLETSLLYSEDGEIIDAGALGDGESEMYSYSIQTEMEIIFCIKKGDYKGAYEIISREINEFLKVKNYPVYLIRCFMIELAGTILKAVGEIEKNSEEEVALSRSSSIGRLFSATTITEMELLVQEYLKEVCDFVALSNSYGSSTVCEDIKQYVREHYADVEMNVNAIAEQFHLNSAYLSNMFKRNTGIKLLEYINKVRVDEAKKLIIQNPNMSIEEIAERSGFANSRTFRRIFLKYENTAPSKFAKF